MVRSAPSRVSNHLAHCLLPSFETPRDRTAQALPGARAAPQDEVNLLKHDNLMLRGEQRERLEA
jgi:hypothetical protein